MKYLKIFLVVLCCLLNLYLNAQSNIPDNYNLVYEQDFESPDALNDFDMTDSTAWRITSLKNGKSLELFGKSNYESRVRSPFNIAILKKLAVGDFILEVNLMQTGKEYNHRDLCLFFGFNNPTNFYYVHIASQTDNNANNIFLVNDEPRKRISTKTALGTNWGSTGSWHKVRIERSIDSGSIKVYFDDMTQSIMEATDLHFIEGFIGLGSFDDTGVFDNIKIWSPSKKVRLKSFFNY